MNRNTLRQIRALPIRDFENTVNQVIYDETQKAKAHAYNHGWACLFLAFIDRIPWLKNAVILHSVAVDTLEYMNGIEPASELGAKLKERTGFDMYERPQDSDLPYLEKGEALLEWQSAPNEHRKGQKFICPACQGVAYYPQGRDAGEHRRCPYRYCPNCGTPIRPKEGIK